MSNTPSPKRRKRDIILDEATLLFNDQGYHDTRLEDIAAKIGTGKTNISYHFKSKETILGEAYYLACEFSEAELTLAMKAPNGLERALAFIRAHLQAHANALTGLRPPLTLMNEFTAFQEPEQSTMSGRFEKHIHGFKNFLIEGLEDGSVDVASVEASTFFVFNVLHWIPRWLDAINERRHDEAIDGLIDLLRNGLATDKNRLSAIPLSRSNSGDYPAIFDKETRNRLKKEAFLRTGTRYLNTNGYRNLSLDDIAKDLGVTRGAFYYHIADKESLFVQCFERSCNLIEEAQIKASESEAPTALAELEQAIRWLFENHVTNLDPLLRMNLIHALPPATKAAIRARLRRLQATFAELVARGMLDNSVNPIEVEACEHIILGAIFAGSGNRFTATSLNETWHVIDEPIAASALYFEPLLTGLSAK